MKKIEPFWRRFSAQLTKARIRKEAKIRERKRLARKSA